MQNLNKEFYHISRQNNWSVDSVITAGINENPFWCICKNCSVLVTVNQQQMPVFEMINQKYRFDVTQENIDFLYQTIENVSKETALYIREQIFEDVRKTNFPHLPSRQKCLWLCDKETLPYWNTAVTGPQRYLLALKIDGQLFCGDANWLTADTLSSVEYANRATHYWSGEMTADPRKEYLFYGEAVVKAITQIQ